MFQIETTILCYKVSTLDVNKYIFLRIAAKKKIIFLPQIKIVKPVLRGHLKNKENNGLSRQVTS